MPAKKPVFPLITNLIPAISFARSFWVVVVTFMFYLFHLTQLNMNFQAKSKSPLTLLLLISCLIIATLVMISNYFLRPGIELDLKNRIVSKIYSYHILNPKIKVEGRDVVLSGIALNKTEAAKITAEIESVSGINQLDSRLMIQNQSE